MPDDAAVWRELYLTELGKGNLPVLRTALQGWMRTDPYRWNHVDDVTAALAFSVAAPAAESLTRGPAPGG